MIKLLLSTSDKTYDSILLLGKYKQIWNTYGALLLEVFETVTDLKFTHGMRANVVIVHGEGEGSHSGVTDRAAIRLVNWKSYVDETYILWLLSHEIGHRLLGNNKIYIRNIRSEKQKNEANYESHRVLFIILIEVIKLAFPLHLQKQLLDHASKKYEPTESLWDESYRDAWAWANALTPEQRRQLITYVAKKKTLKIPDDFHFLYRS